MRAAVLFVFIVGVNSTLAWTFRRDRTAWKNLGLPELQPNEVSPREIFFQQKVTHFDVQDQRTWRQRYYVNDQFYNSTKNLVFLMIGGEGPADARWMVKGAWIEYAEELQAMCVMVEHRFYGKSRPFPNLTLENLQYLSSKQALADLAYFIENFNVKYNIDSPRWIVFGGSYPGSLAAWMRLKYPHLVFAAVSSSGPLKAEMDFQDYYKIVVEALTAKTGKTECVELLRIAFTQFKGLMIVDPEIIERYFNVCKPLKKSSYEDKMTLQTMVADMLGEVVQYNEDNRVLADSARNNVTIKTVCDMLGSPDDTMYINLGKFAKMITAMDNQTCLNYSYDDAIAELRREDVPENDSDRQWFYQTCTEFGFYQTFNGETDIFGSDVDLDYYVRQCMDVFGKRFNHGFIREAVRATNRYYGGIDIKVSRVLYVHGSIDPWHALGIIESRDNSSPAIFINGTAHCANMYPSAGTDLPALVAARAAIRRQLRAWAALP